MATKAPPVDEKLWEEILRIMGYYRNMHPEPKRADLPIHLGTLSNGSQMWVVDGDQIKTEERDPNAKSNRSDSDMMDFVEGGNGEEDPQVCEKHEIVVDWNLRPHEWPLILYHEEVERRDMAGGMKYNEAHARANHQERALRLRLQQGRNNGQS